MAWPHWVGGHLALCHDNDGAHKLGLYSGWSYNTAPGGGNVPARDAHLCLEEKCGAPRVTHLMGHGQGQHDAAAAQVRDLHKQQRARRVQRGCRGHEQVWHLASWHELAHLVIEREAWPCVFTNIVPLPVYSPVVVELEASCERVGHDQRLGEAMPDDIRHKELLITIGPEGVDHWRVPVACGKFQVGHPDAAHQSLVSRDDHLRHQHCHHRTPLPRSSSKLCIFYVLDLLIS